MRQGTGGRSAVRLRQLPIGQGPGLDRQCGRGKPRCRSSAWPRTSGSRSWRDTGWQRRGPDYEAFKQRLSDRLLRKFLEVVPQARGHIEHSELSTPLSTRHFSNHPYGEIYGLEHTPERFRLPWLRTHTPVKKPACSRGRMWWWWA